MKKLFAIFAALTLSLLATQSFAADLKIGIIDMTQVLQKAPLMVSLNNGLTKKFQPRQNELIDAQKKLQDDNSQLNINGASMSNDQRSKLQTQILTDQANVQVLTANLQKDVAIAKDDALNQFMAKFNQVITKIAQDGQYDLIQQSSGFAYINPQLNITQDVIKQLS
jgi:outer membrane protein